DRAVLDELIHHAVRHVDRDGESDADVAAAARENGGVDADQLAPEIDERAPRVAGGDGGVRLDEVLVPIGIDARAGEAADDSRGHRVLKPERIADGDHKIAHLDLGRVAQGDLGEVVRLDLEYRDIGRLVAADDLRLQVATVLKSDRDLAGV